MSKTPGRSPIVRASRIIAGFGLAAALVPMSMVAVSSAGATPHSGGAKPAGHGPKGPKGQGHDSFTGNVATVGTGTFTVTVAGGASTTTETVDVSSTTKYSEPGVKGASIADILVGDKVRVTGESPTPGTVDASKVFVYMAKTVGKVTSVGTGSFVITGKHDATITVDVSSLTVYKEPKVKGATFANIAVGDKVHVIGAQATPGTINATLVFIVPAKTGEGNETTTTTTTIATTTTTTV